MRKILNFILSGYVRLLFPLLICFILIEKLLHILHPAVHFLKEKLHITRFVGVLDIFLISLLLLSLTGLLAGLLLKSGFVTRKIREIEEGLLRKIPVYNKLKSLFGIGSQDPESANYRPALLKDGENYSLGYITDQSENYCTVVICDTNLQAQELRVVTKDSIRLLNISFLEFAKRIRNYGIHITDFVEKPE